MMNTAAILRLTALLLALSCVPAGAQRAVPAPEVKPGTSQETVQSDISTREIAIQSNFTGIEILIFGSIDFSDSRTPGEGRYDVISVVRGPSEPIVLRKKEEPVRLLAGIAAPIDEVIRAARHAGPLRRVPVLPEFRIEMVAALGRLDEGEMDAGLAHLPPVDVALPVRDVDALDRHGVGADHALMRFDVLERARKRAAPAREPAATATVKLKFISRRYAERMKTPPKPR
ncbi:hypothetical protein AUC71_03665 [Methyloceanibacter marginalis]|uniref:Uncharacterized protein n=1 Tax=Methyloceanibacter marginalis TaxID=1774971 RepID=A0A1E3W346_9HYPH|nr:hypothetical protein AUC71_03665 [Methyloceanibacter marginalis]